MNILVLSWRDPKHPLAGGAEQVMHEHMKGWVRAGHKVTLFSSKFKNALKKEKLDGITILRKGDQFIGVKVQAFFFWKENKEKFDLVVDQFHGIPFFTPLYVKKPKLAVLQEVAREVWFMNELPFPFNWLIGFMGYIFEPFIFLLYKNISFMVGSKSAKEDLLTMKIPFNNINIVPHGVIVEKFKTVPKKERVKTICFLGALAKDKGIEDALKSFSILNSKGKFNFWVIGRGSPEYKTYLLTLCEKYGIIDRVKFWDYVDNKKKFELLARAHVLVNPSAREGWGLVNIEANSVGTPVISYKSVGLIDS
ncbi:MAG: glycosyltransferase family 4 protein, partial [bacterium]